MSDASIPYSQQKEEQEEVQRQIRAKRIERVARLADKVATLGTKCHAWGSDGVIVDGAGEHFYVDFPHQKQVLIRADSVQITEEVNVPSVVVQQCQNCRCFVAHDILEGFGICRRFPPIPLATDEGVEQSLPVIKQDDWCGEWRANEA